MDRWRSACGQTSADTFTLHPARAEGLYGRSSKCRPMLSRTPTSQDVALDIAMQEGARVDGEEYFSDWRIGIFVEVLIGSGGGSRTPQAFLYALEFLPRSRISVLRRCSSSDPRWSAVPAASHGRFDWRSPVVKCKAFVRSSRSLTPSPCRLQGFSLARPQPVDARQAPQMSFLD